MVQALERRGLRAEARATAAPGDAMRLSRDARDAGVETIVVHGGDGTINEVLQPLVGGTTPLAVWPGGTANVLAKELELPTDLDRVADMVAAGRTRRVSRWPVSVWMPRSSAR
jgi:diacylglycerol kinase family enzyme